MAFNARANFTSQSTAANEPHQLDRATAYSVDQDPALEIKSAGVALWRIVWNSATNKLRVTVGEWAATAIAAIYGGTGLTTYTIGDLLYSSAANTLAKLAGNTTTTKKFLSQTGDGTDSAAPVWETIDVGDINATGTPSATTYLRGDGTWTQAGIPKRGTYYRTNAVNIGTGATWSAIGWDAETSDPDLAHDTGSNPERITAPADGFFYVTAQAFYENNGLGTYRAIGVAKNAAATPYRQTQVVQNTTGVGTPVALVGTVVPVSSGDYIKILTRQDSGSDRALVTGEDSTWVNVLFWQTS